MNLFFGPEGILPVSAFGEWFQSSLQLSFFRFFPQSWVVWTGHFALLGSLLALAAGFRARLAAIIAFLLHVSFMNRNMAAAYGADFIISFYLFFLALADHRKPNEKKVGDFQDQLGSVAFRFAQLQICIIYLNAGWKKLKGPSWWSGDAMWMVLSNGMLARWNFDWVAQFSELLSLSALVTLLWEIYFPVLVWQKRFRPYLLAIGVLLHVFIALGMSLTIFSALMVSVYVLFLDDQELDFLKFWTAIPKRLLSGR